MSYKNSREIADKVCALMNAKARDGVCFEVVRATVENTLFYVSEYERDHIGVAQFKGQVFVTNAMFDEIAKQEVEKPVEPETNRFERLQREFPDFDVATLPEIPAGFVDVSWHNDACPSFYNEPAGLILFVDYAEITDRELQEVGARFILKELNGPTCLIESDDWQAVLTALENDANPVAIEAAQPEIKSGDTVAYTFYGADKTGIVERLSSDGAIVFLRNGRWLHRESVTSVIASA